MQSKQLSRAETAIKIVPHSCSILTIDYVPGSALDTGDIARRTWTLGKLTVCQEGSMYQTTKPHICRWMLLKQNTENVIEIYGEDAASTIPPVIPGSQSSVCVCVCPNVVLFTWNRLSNVAMDCCGNGGTRLPSHKRQAAVTMSWLTHCTPGKPADMLKDIPVVF